MPINRRTLRRAPPRDTYQNIVGYYLLKMCPDVTQFLGLGGSRGLVLKVWQYLKGGVTEKKVKNSENQENIAVTGIRINVNLVLVWHVML